MAARDATPPVIPGLLPGYAELQCLSHFTFLRGASRPDELVDRAHAAGYAALALADECSLAGVVRAYEQARRLENGPDLIVGSQFRLDGAPGGHPPTLVALACDLEGYGNLSELITLARSRAPKGQYRLDAADLAGPAAEAPHLRGLPNCLLILAPDAAAPPDTVAAQARWLAAACPGRAWIGLTLLHRSTDARHRAAVDAAARASGLPVVATGRAEMHVRSRKPLHDTLCAIRLGRPVADCGAALAPNAEQHLRSRLQLATLYPPDALAQTLVVARRCRFSLSEIQYVYPDEIVPAGHTPASYLRQEVQAGARRRFADGLPDGIAQRIEEELALIETMRFEPYFLTVYDIVRVARERGILCQGRGSAANSVVCYCLGITAVRPGQTALLFGRFISRERNEPPDIDVDFEHERREEIIQYLYRRYGRARAALTAVVISYRTRSALRDVGKALGADAALIDRIAAAQQWWDGMNGLLQRFEACGLDPHGPLARRWAWLTAQLLNFPRHLSQHPGGFVLAPGKLSRMVPIEQAAMPGRSVVQWDKDDLDTLGLLKVDVLSLGMLTVLRKALDLANARRGTRYGLYDLPADDAATYDMICRADTIGVFQIESRAQMSMLPRLRPRCYYDLVVEVAIVRPGPIQGGMVHPYLQRRRAMRASVPPDDDTLYPRPELRAALARTLGVPIFQEQVMQIAMIGAGFSEGEADGLRRSMAAWRRKGGVEKYRERLIDGMIGKGYARDFAEAIYRQVEGFGEYGFPESHAASFALLAYASAWLKCHEPEAFLAALLNSQPMGFYSPSQLVQDARRHGVAVLPVDVGASDADATLVPRGASRPAVRLGLHLVRGLPRDAALRIQAARAAAPFADAADLARRADLDAAALDALAAADALHGLSGHRRRARWEVAASVPDRDLLRAAARPDPSPDLPRPSEAQDIQADYGALQLTLRRHPLALLRGRLEARGFQPAATLHDYPDRRLARACGLVTLRQRPGTAKGILFLTLEDESGQVNVVVRPELVARERAPLLQATLLGVYGVWQAHEGVASLLASRFVDLTPWLGGIAVDSRDFH